MAPSTSLLSLPNELLITLPNYLSDIEDYKNLASTCRTFRQAMAVANPRQILSLAIESSRVFFRRSPEFLVMATARELGKWARQSPENEQEFRDKLENGLDAMLELAKEHCGLTMERIRELYEARFSLINPVANIMDKCVGNQWYRTPNFWDGGADDAYTIQSEPEASVYHLAIYGELFGPDLDIYLKQDSNTRSLSIETRLEFVKYCIPDVATIMCQKSAWRIQLEDGTIDPRRATKYTGPYADEKGPVRYDKENNIALTWIIKSTRWKPHWVDLREAVGPDFGELNDQWYQHEGDWRQRMWETSLISQGLYSYEMMMLGMRRSCVDRATELRKHVENLQQEPARVYVGTTFTYECPWLAGDLRCLTTGYVSGT